MNLKRYLFVEDSNIQLINYIFTDQNQYNTENDYIKPRIIPLGGESSVSTFDRNGIPTQYQKVFMSYNPISMGLMELKGSKNNLRPNKHSRFKVRGFLTNTPIYLAISSNNTIFGQMAGYNPRFDVFNCCECSKEDINQFFNEIVGKGLFDNYLKSISEILQFKIKSNFDSNKIMSKKK